MLHEAFLIFSTLTAFNPSDSLSDEARKLIDIVKDARVANEARLHSGTLSAEVFYLRQVGLRPVELKADVTWDDRHSLWSYQIRDPDTVVTPEPTKDVPVDLLPREFMLRTPRGLYEYNHSTNTVHLEEDKRIDTRIFELTPLVHWTQCHSPHLMNGRAWTEMIGPHRDFKSSQFTVMLEGSDMIRQVRHDGSAGTFTLLLSLAASGNVVEAYYAATGDDRSQKQTFSWGKTAEGVCVLKECEFQTSLKGRPDVIDTTYRLKISKISLKKIDPLVFSERNLFSKLPRGFIFADSISKRSYKNADKRAVTDQELEALSDDLRSSDFLKH